MTPTPNSNSELAYPPPATPSLTPRGNHYPKLLSDPSTQGTEDATYSVANHDGTFSKPSKLVEDYADEVTARAEGYTVTLPDPTAPDVSAVAAAQAMQATPDPVTPPSPTLPTGSLPEAPTPITPVTPPAPVPVAVAPPVVLPTPDELAAVEDKREELKAVVATKKVDVLNAQAVVVATPDPAEKEKAQAVVVEKREALGDAQADLMQHHVDTYTPILIQPKISVTILVGAQNAQSSLAGVPQLHLAKPSNKTGFISWHDTVYDILARISEATDGSLVMLIPGSAYPFQMWDMPYAQLRDGATVYVVPNRPDQVGPSAVAAVNLP